MSAPFIFISHGCKRGGSSPGLRHSDQMSVSVCGRSGTNQDQLKSECPRFQGNPACKRSASCRFWSSPGTDGRHPVADPRRSAYGLLQQPRQRGRTRPPGAADRHSGDAVACRSAAAPGPGPARNRAWNIQHRLGRGAGSNGYCRSEGSSGGPPALNLESRTAESCPSGRPMKGRAHTPALSSPLDG
jgi:hypothetical protein